MQHRQIRQAASWDRKPVIVPQIYNASALALCQLEKPQMLLKDFSTCSDPKAASAMTSSRVTNARCSGVAVSGCTARITRRSGSDIPILKRGEPYELGCSGLTSCSHCSRSSQSSFVRFSRSSTSCTGRQNSASIALLYGARRGGGLVQLNREAFRLVPGAQAPTTEGIPF